MYSQEDRNKYSCHKSKAKARGITFDLTFDEWWSIWEQSGKYALRGCRKGQYVMSRKGDIGSYSIHNVFIQSCEDNHRQVQLSSQARLVMSSKSKSMTRTDEHKANQSKAMMGKNKGKVYGPRIKETI
jgi:hypothetical protein